MDRLFVTYRFEPNTISDLDFLIDKLIEYKKELKRNEDAEVIIVCNVEKAEIKIGLATLAPTEIYDKSKSYEVIPGENITLFGKCDLLTEDNHWKRLFPPIQ